MLLMAMRPRGNNGRVCVVGRMGLGLTKGCIEQYGDVI